jgi:hypothetical protein
MDKPAPGSHVPQGEPGLLGRSIDAAIRGAHLDVSPKHMSVCGMVSVFGASGRRKEGLLFGETLLL